MIFFSSRFILKEGHLYLSSDYLKMIWTTLAEQAVYPQDREQCFRWFAEVKTTNSK
jgi:ubiquitin carboxyl-terminal hydrolase 9/24